MSKAMRRAFLLPFCLLAGIGGAWLMHGVFQKSAVPVVRVDASEVSEYLEAGDHFLAEERYSLALTNYEGAARLDPGNVGVRMRIAQIYQAKNRYSDAEQELLFIHELDPDNTEALYRLATINRAVKQFERADEFLDQLTPLLDESDPAQANIQFLRGEVALWRSDFEAARQAFEQAVALNPEWVSARYYQAMLQIPLDAGGALSNLRALEIDASAPLYDKVEAAITQLANLGTAGSDNERQLLLASLFIEQNLPTLALGFAKQVADAEPEYQQAHTYLGYAYFLLGDLTEAERRLIYSQQISETPSALSYYYLGQLYSQLESFAQAAEAYERAIFEGKTEAAVYYRLGLALNQEAAYTKATKSMELALEQEPHNLAIITSLINTLLTQLKDPERAQQVGEKAIQTLPEEARAYSLLGWAQYEAGEYDAASVSLSAALKLDPREASAHYNHGMLLQAQGQTAQAIEAYRLALDYDQQGGIALLADRALAQMTER